MKFIEVTSQIRLADFVRSDAADAKHSTLIQSLVLDNCVNSALCSDVRALEVNRYTKGPLAREDIPVLRNMFVDNVCFFMLVPSDTIKGRKTEECGDGCTAIDNVVRKYNALPENKANPIKVTRRPVRTVNFHSTGNAATSTMILNRIAKDPRILERYRAIYPNASPTDFGYVTYKLALSSNDFNNTFRFLKFAEPKLIDRGMFQQDIDLTKDVGCSFDKAKLADLIMNLPPDTEMMCTVVDNDKTVGKHCLTFISTCPDTGIVIRFKIYNKFIQAVETAGVADMFGYSVDDWINNKDDKMRESILKSLEFGFSRLEMTIYSSELHTREWYDEKMQFLEEQTIGTNTMLQTPISEQWRAFTDELSCNMAIIDLVSMEIGIAMWANGLTQRVGGVLIEIPKSLQNDPARLQDWVAAHYSYAQGPINIITIEKEASLEDGYLQATLRSFRKVGSNMATYVPFRAKGGNGFVYSKAQREHRSRAAFRENDAIDVGLIDTPSVSLRIFNKLINLQTSALECEFVQEDPLVDKLLCRNRRQRNAAEREAINVEELAFEMAKIRIANDQRIHDAAELVKKQASLDELDALVTRNLSARIAKSISTIPINTTVRVYAFKPIATRWSDQKYLLWTDSGTLWSNKYIEVCIENNKSKIDIHENGYFFKSGVEHVFIFVRAGNASDGGNKFAKTHSLHFIRPIEPVNPPDCDKTAPQVLNTMPPLRNIDLLLMDKLKENTIFEIQGIKMHKARSKIRYHVQIDDKYYLSNNWFEQIMKTRFEDIIEGGVWVECKTLGREPSPISKKRELQFVV